MASFLSPAVQSGLLGPGVDVDQTPTHDLSRLGQIPGMLAQGALDATAGFTKRALSGRLTQQQMIEGAADAAMTVGGGGMLVPKPLGALGVFGGKVRSPVGKAKVVDLGPGSHEGVINQRIRLPSGAEGEVVSFVKRNLDNRNTVELDLNFSVKDPRSGRLSTELAGFGAKEGRDFLTAALNESRRHIALVRPSRVTFSAADDSLVPLYNRLTKKIAKETGGTVHSMGPKSSFFQVDLPNPREFKAGMLDQ